MGNIKIEHPDDAGYEANIKGVSLTVESHFAYAGDFGEPPKQVFAKLSRFLFAVIDKNAAQKCVTANLRTDEFPAVLRKGQWAFDRCLESEYAPSAAPKEAGGDRSSAYTVKMAMGPFKGKSPAQVLIENPERADDLRKHYEFLDQNAQKYPANRVQMDAIIEAISLYREGRLQPVAVQEAGDSTVITVHDSGPRHLASRGQQNGKTFCYQLRIACQPSNNYPFEISVSNFYAPVIERPGGQKIISQKEKESEVRHAMRLSKEAFLNLLEEMAAEMHDYRCINAMRGHRQADEARRENIEAARREAM